MRTALASSGLLRDRNQAVDVKHLPTFPLLNNRFPAGGRANQPGEPLMWKGLPGLVPCYLTALASPGTGINVIREHVRKAIPQAHPD